MIAGWFSALLGGLGRQDKIAFWSLIGLGALIRLVFAYGTDGAALDLQTVIVGLREQLRDDPLGVYGSDYGGTPAWIYPPGYFAWVAIADRVSFYAGIPFETFVRFAGAVSDLLIAILVQYYLALKGATSRQRILALALIALGPPFFVSSTIHGQIDSVAILFAVGAFVYWEKNNARSRGVVAGTLLGVAASIKQVPGMVALALLPQARSNKERLQIVGLLAAVPLLLILPWFLASPSDTIDSLQYSGIPGTGGLSLILQPDLALGWLSTGFGAGNLGFRDEWSSLTETTQDIAPIVLLIALACSFVFLMRHRVEPALGASFIWLTIYVFGFNFFVTYLVWGLPFFVMAGALRTVLVVEALWLIPLAFTYATEWVDAPSSTLVNAVYTPFMIGAWLAAVIALVLLARRIRGLPDEGSAATGVPVTLPATAR